MPAFKSICIHFLVVLSLVGCKYDLPGKTPAPSGSMLHVADKPAILATIREDIQSPASDLRVTFASRGGGVAYTSNMGDRTLVFHNDRPGSQHEGIGSLTLSPDGTRIAYTAIDNGKWRVFVDGKAGEPFDIVEGEDFSPDGKHFLFQGMKNDQWQLVIDGKVGATGGKRFREYGFCGDSAHVAYIDQGKEIRKGRLVLNDIAFKDERIIEKDITTVYFNADKTVIAAISKSSSGKEKVTHFNVASPDAVTRAAEYDKVLNVALAPTGADLAYFGERQGRLYGVFNGQEELLAVGVVGTTVINQAGKSVGVLLQANDGSHLYEMFGNKGRKGNVYDETEWLVYGSDGTASAFTGRKGKNWFVVTNGVEGPAFDRVVSPKFSPDGRFLVYRARKDGKRFVVVADAAGKVLRQHSAYEQVFDVQFTGDGKSVAYGVKDGQKLMWRVEPLSAGLSPIHSN
jgi:WD40 repeat protein